MKRTEEQRNRESANWSGAWQVPPHRTAGAPDAEQAEVGALETRQTKRAFTWRPRAPVILLRGMCWLALVGAIAFAPLPVRAEGATLSPFGIGSCYINNRSAQDDARWIPQMAAIGIRVMRTCHTEWRNVEPEEGRWTWPALDNQMGYMASNKMEFGGLLLGSVPWEKSDQAAGLPVSNLPAWSTYVSELVRHCRGKVKYWEVWNEPPNFTAPNQTPADYAKVVVAAYDAAKAADPACLVGLAGKSVHVNYLEQVIKAGAKDHFDYVTLHPYEVLGTVADNAGTEALYMNIVPTVRKMLAAQNPAKKLVPIIFTELGYDASKGADQQGQALVKAYCMGIAQGVACIQWFEGRDGDSGPMGLLDNQGNPRPAYTALAQMIQYFGQHPVFQGWVLLNNRNYGFVFQGAQTTILATWSPRGVPDQVNFGREVQIVDPLTGRSVSASTYELGTAPILVVGVPADLMTQARANRTRPLPWGGDYAHARSVSVTMGEQNTEKGLHTLSGDAIAADVVAYGGAARAGNVPGGNAFVVDPGFLSYAATPIEISVIVRRNPANDNAGFKLVYESTDGFKNRGWYTVPDNKQWHRMTWRIDDPQFVGMWGYNFALESDGNQYNKYYLRSVTVTKLASTPPP
jgi:polysaccharide biosynthesis protein PslG